MPQNRAINETETETETETCAYLEVFDIAPTFATGIAAATRPLVLIPGTALLEVVPITVVDIGIVVARFVAAEEEETTSLFFAVETSAVIDDFATFAGGGGLSIVYPTVLCASLPIVCCY